MTEHRDIIGQPGFVVGDDGVVWTWWRRVKSGRVWRDRPSGEWTVVDQQPHNHGYLCVQLYDRKRLLHVVVLEAFVGPCPPGMQCRHLDGDKKNNALSNLRWGTQSENELDKIEHGTFQIGESNGYAFLTEDDVRTIRELRKSGMSYGRINRMFRTKQARNVCIGRTWSHVV